MKKILVTGSSGMLGRALCRILGNKLIPSDKIHSGEADETYRRNRMISGNLVSPQASSLRRNYPTGFKVFGLGSSGRRSEDYINCDIRCARKLINQVSRIRPALIIHTAAISDVEYCEVSPNKARDVNTLGTQNIARAAKAINAILIYISTDYVFAGRNKRPYRENDAAGPVNVYGKTKYSGENSLRQILERYLIIRTSWLFGPGRDNFVTRIIERAKKENEMNIIADKFASPTYSLDLACAIRDLILLLTANRDQLAANRILHISNSGSCSRFEFTQEILQCAKIRNVKVVPIKSSAFGWRAQRPAYSVLDNTQFRNIFGYKLRPWRQALKEYLEKITSLH